MKTNKIELEKKRKRKKAGLAGIVMQKAVARHRIYSIFGKLAKEFKTILSAKYGG